MDFGDYMNDQERKNWVMNDEGLYNWWRSSRQGITQFIKENRTEIDRAINNVLNRPSFTRRYW